MWRTIQVRPLVKAIGALALVAILWQLLVSSAFSQLQSAPLATAKSRDLVGISVPYPTDSVYLTLVTRAGSDEALLDVQIHADNVTTTPSEPARIVLFGDSVRTIKACSDSEVSIATPVNQEALTPELKTLVWDHIRQQKQTDYEATGRSEFFPSDQEIADVAANQTYSVIELAITPSTYSQSGADGVTVRKSRLYLSATCSLDPKRFWTDQAPDTRLTSPVFAFATSTTTEDRVGFVAGTDVQAGMDYSLLRATQVQDETQDQELLTWQWSPSMWSNDQGWRYAADDGLSAVFRSAAEDRRVQNELFVAGVALGIIGSLVISVFNSLTDVVGDAVSLALKGKGSRAETKSESEANYPISTKVTQGDEVISTTNPGEPVV